ncbi:ATP12 family chaperone protein [Granulibacter bethesdensis]|uniref:ATP12 family chaperone protein n=1 Tax=Granulibacter bethesdensis TaxID=364410 RepID=UPI00090B0D0D|nr:ATP12 family protein [Granulibacter bethesdensis]APH58900.1 Chaperone, ATP12 family protein [Granulibacter bethesdensis]
MKRFWKEAAVVQEAAGLAVTLDGRPMRLPGGVSLRFANRALAEAIAVEWGQAGAPGEPFSFDMVPMTRLAGTAQERVAVDPAASVEALVSYGGSDLLCYRADGPEELTTRQERLWQPLLDWAEQRYGARLYVTTGIIHVSQPEASLMALRAALTALAPAALAALGIVVPALGSLVIGLALAEGRLDPPEALEIALLDDLYQEEKWGADAEAAKRRAHLAADVETAIRFLRLSAGVAEQDGEAAQ